MMSLGLSCCSRIRRKIEGWNVLHKEASSYWHTSGLPVIEAKAALRLDSNGTPNVGIKPYLYCYFIAPGKDKSCITLSGNNMDDKCESMQREKAKSSNHL